MLTRTANATDKLENAINDGLSQGLGKLKEFEYQVHLRSKRFQRKLAALSVAILVLILGVGLYALSAYNAFLEITSPSLAAFYTGSALLLIGFAFAYLGTQQRVLGLGLPSSQKRHEKSGGH